MPAYPSGEILRPQSWSYEEFKAALIDCTIRVPKTRSELPQSLDGGAIISALRQMVEETQVDPRHLERGRLLKLGLDHKTISLQTRSQVGQENEVYTRSRLMRLQSLNPSLRKYDKSEKLIASLHTHPSDHPASPLDLSHLFTEEDESGTVGQFIGMPNANFLFMRTLYSPIMTRAEADKWVELQDQRIQDLHDQQLQPYATIGMQKAGFCLANNQVVREICEANDIAVYMSLGNNTVMTESSV